MKRFVAALRFLTILPIPGTWGSGGAELAGSVPFFPLVGLVAGGLAALLAWGLARMAVPPLIASAVIIVALLSISGALHMDGLSDTADGFLSSRSKERILEIMKDSHVGAMGVVAVVCVMLLKFAALASLPPAKVWRVVLLMPLAGRCMMVLQMVLLPYARPGGLGTVFYRSTHRMAAAWAVAVLAGAGWLALGGKGLIAAATCVAVTLLFCRYCWRKIGGATGDTFGAACELVELVPALVLACW